MEQDGRITVRELLAVLNTEVENGNGDCLIFVEEFYLTNKFRVEKEEIWGNTMYIGGIHVQDVETTLEQDEESNKMVEDYYKNLGPEEKKVYDDLKKNVTFQTEEEWKNRQKKSNQDKPEPKLKDFIMYVENVVVGNLEKHMYYVENEIVPKTNEMAKQHSQMKEYTNYLAEHLDSIYCILEEKYGKDELKELKTKYFKTKTKSPETTKNPHDM